MDGYEQNAFKMRRELLVVWTATDASERWLCRRPLRHSLTESILKSISCHSYVSAVHETAHIRMPAKGFTNWRGERWFTLSTVRKSSARSRRRWPGFAASSRPSPRRRRRHPHPARVGAGGRESGCGAVHLRKLYARFGSSEIPSRESRRSVFGRFRPTGKSALNRLLRCLQCVHGFVRLNARFEDIVRRDAPAAAVAETWLTCGCCSIWRSGRPPRRWKPTGRKSGAWVAIRSRLDKKLVLVGGLEGAADAGRAAEPLSGTAVQGLPRRRRRGR